MKYTLTIAEKNNLCLYHDILRVEESNIVIEAELKLSLNVGLSQEGDYALIRERHAPYTIHTKYVFTSGSWVKQKQ